MSTFKRSSVTKILAAELTRTTHTLPKGEQQYDPQTYLSPTGRTIAKVMICGTAIEKEDVGNDSSMWRVRISDSSGTVQIYAGMYQPEAAAVISQLDIPCFVSVVGKLNIYEPEEGSHIVSIRPDSVTVIDGKARDDFILDAALSLIRNVRETSDEQMKKAVDIYSDKDDKKTYIFVARQAIESLLPEHNDKAGEDKKQEVEQHHPTPSPPDSSSPSFYQTDTDKTIDSGIKTVQEVILELLLEKKTVKFEEIPDMLKGRGINPNMVDWTSAIKRMMNEGQCFEPRVGVLRVA